jgi:sugar phosphate isomerase/epimerase
MKMKMGFLSGILGNRSFEEVIDFASAHGFSCVELACWPSSKAGRRYSGISHFDVFDLSDERINQIKEYSHKKQVEISSLAYYPNTMDGDVEKRRYAIEHLMQVMRISKKLDVNMVTTFIGRDQNLSVEENLENLNAVWDPIIRFAEELQIKIGIENCPMLFRREQWPGGQNLMTTPAIWRKVFEKLPSKNLGLNFDPSHFALQMMDYVRPLYEFRDKIFHLHFKDIKIYRDKLNDVGTMAYPHDYMTFKLPGLGDIDWGKFVSAITDIAYDGCACIEVEDPAFEGSDEKKVRDSLILSKRYLEQFVI